MKFSMSHLSAAALVALSVATILAPGARATELVNPGFETDAVSGAAPLSGATGWGTFGNALTAAAPLDPAPWPYSACSAVGREGKPGSGSHPAVDSIHWEEKGAELNGPISRSAPVSLVSP